MSLTMPANDTIYDRLPEQFRGGMRRYIEDRIQPGSTLRAILAHDLFDAVALADAGAIAELPRIVRWIYQEAPHGSHGSYAVVDAWLSAGREPR